MNELLPCPFCGGGLEIVSDPVSEWGLVTHKDGCFFLADGLPIKTQFIRIDSIPAWNTRAKRTCSVEWRINGWGTATRHCGNCGADLDCDTRNSPQSYCPRCGRKVER